MTTLAPLGEVVDSVTAGMALKAGFPACLDDRDWVTVTAVLERTAVIEFPDKAREVANLGRLKVDPDVMETRPLRRPPGGPPRPLLGATISAHLRRGKGGW